MRHLLPPCRDRIPLLRDFIGMLVALTFLAHTSLRAQEAMTIQGKITDAKTGQALAGANVFIKEIGLGAVAGPDGAFSFVVPADKVAGQEAILTARYLGYREKLERLILQGGTHTKDFSLAEDPLGQQEVIITGVVGGTYKEKLAFSVDRIGKNQLEHAPTTTPEQALRGKVAGVRIVKGSGQPGTVAAVQMRGAKSINSLNRASGPLYIVDGVILGSTTVDLDPENIENIEVVKGAAGSSLYGARAANGIVQITTSRGSGLPTGETRVSIRNEYGSSSLMNEINVSKKHSFKVDPSRPDSPWVNYAGARVARTSRVLDTLWRIGPKGAVANGFTTFRDKDYVLPLPNGRGSLYNQMSEFFTGGEFYTNLISVSHRAQYTNFYIALTNRREAGIVAGNNGYGIQTLRANVDHEFIKGLDLAFSGLHSSSKRADFGGNNFFALTFMPPDVDLRAPNSDGQPFNILPEPASLESNPLYATHFREVEQKRKRTLGNLTLKYKPLDFFDIEGNMSYDRTEENNTDYTPRGYKTVNPLGASTGTRYISDGGSQAVNGSFTASLNYDFGDLSTRTKVRYLFEDTRGTFEDGAGDNFAIAEIQSLSVTTTNWRVSSSQTQVKSDGYFFITGLDYQGKYIADFLIRNDGSSLFGTNNRRATYYRVSGAYRIAQEPWWFAPDEINELKLRYSIGTAGGRPSFAAQYETWNVSSGVVSKGTLGNKDLRPENSREQELGLEIGLFDRFLLELTYANTVTKDQILQIPLAGYYGYGSQWKNAGTLESNTIEASLKAFIIQTGDMSWSANLLFDRTRQKITEFDLPAYRTGPSNSFYVRKDEVLGAMYGLKWMKSPDDLPAALQPYRDRYQVNDDGYLVYVGAGNSFRDGISKKMWGTVDTIMSNPSYFNLPGRYLTAWGMPIKFQDANPLIGDFVSLGNVLPDFNMAFSSTFRLGGFTTYVLFDAQIGGQIYNQTRQWNLRELVGGEVDQVGKTDDTKKPINYYTTLYSTNATNSHFVENGDYLKLRELSIRYTFDRAQLQSFFGSWFNRITVGVIGRNLVTWTKYKGYDPEVGQTTGQGDAVTFRFDGFTYPNFRTFTGNLEIEF
ncbi:MAG: TonB-linked outer rane protein, SusC/RagA family [Bacteroidetes bacterium]|nr:TonB-linked outer rane protein, SusC/RagA family [Bacteroidota bacterium]